MPVAADPAPEHKQYAHPEMLVTADWVAEHANDPECQGVTPVAEDDDVNDDQDEDVNDDHGDDGGDDDEVEDEGDDDEGGNSGPGSPNSGPGSPNSGPGSTD